MKEIFLPIASSKIHCISFGDGQELLIVFPGYGDRASLFLALQSSLIKAYKVYVVNLPFHSKTEWKTATFTASDIKNIIEQICQLEGKANFDLMGYSFGGRIIQKMMFDLWEQIGKMYLIASDGIATKGMMNAALTPQWIRRFLKVSLDNPNWFLSITAALNKIGIVSNYNHQFIKRQLTNQRTKERMFCTWLSLNEFKLKPKKVKEFMIEKEIDVALYFGKEDKIIPLAAAKWMAEDAPNIKLYELHQNHRLIGEELNILLNKQLNNRKN